MYGFQKNATRQWRPKKARIEMRRPIATMRSHADIV